MAAAHRNRGRCRCRCNLGIAPGGQPGNGACAYGPRRQTMAGRIAPRHGLCRVAHHLRPASALITGARALCCRHDRQSCGCAAHSLWRWRRLGPPPTLVRQAKPGCGSHRAKQRRGHSQRKNQSGHPQIAGHGHRHGPSPQRSLQGPHLWFHDGQFERQHHRHRHRTQSCPG